MLRGAFVFCCFLSAWIFDGWAADVAGDEDVAKVTSAVPTT